MIERCGDYREEEALKFLMCFFSYRLSKKFAERGIELWGGKDESGYQYRFIYFQAGSDMWDVYCSLTPEGRLRATMRTKNLDFYIKVKKNPFKEA